jgi:glycosyltransferase involved in cell wall biosynthesis
MKNRIVISINTAWNIYNFRSGLVKALVEQGYEVVALTPHDEYARRLEELGCRHVSLPMDGNGTNPVRDLMLLLRYLVALRALRPAAYLGYTIKPNVYGSLAAQALGIPVVNNIAGLGATFIKDSYLTKLVRGLYKFALKRSHRIFFQNPDDQALFVQSGLVDHGVSDLLPGSGIDLQRYPANPPPAPSGRPFRFLLVGRMLRDKGVEEFAEAARLVRQQLPNVEFQLLGFVDPANPNSVPLERIEQWEREGLVRFLGKTDDVRTYLAQSDCVVLPSYREGVPRSLLEAAAMARPLIATDVVGCREAVDDGSNGFLCRAKDGADLAEKMLRMLALSPEQREAMGLAGRKKMETQFDEQIVIQRYLSALNAITPATVPRPDIKLLPDRINS